MSRIAPAPDGRMTRAQRTFIPVVSVIAATFIILLPVVVSAPLLPDFAFLVLVAWRLLRPEMWTARTALTLGLLNDIITGNPMGQSMALWTLTFLLFDLIETRIVWRDYWMDWFFAAIAIIFHTWGDWYVARLMKSGAEFSIMLPQVGLSILAYPLVARVVLALDRWRLSR